MKAPPGRRALIVDDNRLDHLLTRGLLLGSNAGFEYVEWLSEWPGAAVALANGPFDLYAVDIHLGAQSGLDVIRELRDAGVLDPIIAMTGRADEEIDRACTAAGASDFLEKGRVDRVVLERSIRYADRQAVVHRELERLNAALERRAQAESEQARLLRFAIEQSNDAIFLTTAGRRLADHPIVFVNAALCRLLGRRAGELLGTDVESLLVSDAAQRDRLARDLEARDSQVCEAALRAASGSVRVHLRATPLRGNDDQVTHYVWTCHGVQTDAASTDASWRRQRDEAVGRLTAGVAHELSERATSMIGNLELLRARHRVDDATRLVDAALRAAEDVASRGALIADIAGQDDTSGPESTDVGATIDRLLPALRLATGRLVQIERRDGDEAGGMVCVQRGRLEVALIMLVASLRRAGGGSIAIGLSSVGRDALAPLAHTLALDPTRDHVALTLRHETSTDGDDAAAPTGVDAMRLEDLVRSAGGILQIERTARGRVDATLYLPRAAG